MAEQRRDLETKLFPIRDIKLSTSKASPEPARGAQQQRTTRVMTTERIEQAQCAEGHKNQPF